MPGVDNPDTLPGTMEQTLYLIRHAQSNPRASVHHSEWPLSRKGYQQAQALVPLLVPLGIGRLFSSPFLRCLQTLGPFAQKAGFEVEIVEDLRERLVTATLDDDFEAVWSKSWKDLSYALPGCESSVTAQDRFVRAIGAIAREGGSEPVGIGAHGNVIGLYLNWLDESNARAECEALTNPDVIRIIHREGEFRWDRDFRATGLEAFATHPDETPFEREDPT